MTAQIGDQITLLPQGLDQPERHGEIRGIRDDPGGVLYTVQWSDTGHESLLPHGPDVVITHRHRRGNGEAPAEATPWLFRLRHPLAWRHSRDLERCQHVRDERLARRVEEIIAGLGLAQNDYSIAGGRIVHIPEVVSVDPGPPERVNIRILPGQSPDDFSAHALTIAYDLDTAQVRVSPLGPFLIRLELLPHDPLPGIRQRTGDTSRPRAATGVRTPKSLRRHAG